MPWKRLRTVLDCRDSAFWWGEQIMPMYAYRYLSIDVDVDEWLLYSCILILNRQIILNLLVWEKSIIVIRKANRAFYVFVISIVFCNSLHWNCSFVCMKNWFCLSTVLLYLHHTVCILYSPCTCQYLTAFFFNFLNDTIQINVQIQIKLGL